MGNGTAECGAGGTPASPTIIAARMLVRLLVILLVTVNLSAAEVRVFAAASLADMLEGLAADYHGGDSIVFNFGASNTLARQIELGAPADLFFSADEASMNVLARRGLIHPETRVVVFTNSLVIVGDGIRAPRDLVGKRVALAEPSRVPAGVYARTYLMQVGLWSAIEPNVVPTENVRGALAAVAAGNVDAAIVYKTDARSVPIAYEIPLAEGPPITYPAALLTNTQHSAAAKRFLAFARARLPLAATTPPPARRTNATGALGITLRTAALSTLLIVPPGLAIAWLLARRRWRGKSLVETLVALPLVMPPVATGLILLHLLGRRGAIGSWLHRTFDVDVVFTWRAVVAAMMVMSFPLLVRAARVAFEEVNVRFEQIARTLGASEARVFATITLPLAARGIVSGMLLAFARAVGEFGATILVAGNIPGRTTTLSVAIYNLVQLGRDGDAFRLVGFAVAIAFAAVWLAEAVSRKAAA